MLKDETASIEEVAEAMGRSVQWIKRNSRKLYTERGFPRPLPDSNWRWPRRALQLWFIAGGEIRSADNNNMPGLVDLQRSALEERYGITKNRSS